MSELSENLNSKWIKATGAFGHTPEKTNVQLFVEGDDDVKFWQEAVKKYQQTYNINVVTNKAVNPAEGDGKGKLLSMSNLGAAKIVAVDADFDLIVKNYSQYTNMVMSDPFVVHTTWHSLENILMQKTDYIDLLENFSLSSWDLFAYYLVTVEKKVEESPIKHYGKMLSEFDVEKCAIQNNFEPFISKYHESLSTEFTLYASEIDKEKNTLYALGYDESNIWKLTRGHNLWNMIVKPQIVNDYKEKKAHNIQLQLEEGKQVDKIKALNDLGIFSSIEEHVEHDFYYGDMSSANVPSQTRAKLDSLFP